MIVLKKWREHPQTLIEEGLPIDWFPVTLEECIGDTEVAGYWKHNTVKELLDQGHEVWNPFASFKKGGGDDNTIY